ncbi:MAG TPA: HEAT repeat domain-containing protein, partial [Kofleriaceae bacterium]|nr:HEAT repeat domain-containing protein [Kofleriaceae bacterium]
KRGVAMRARSIGITIALGVLAAVASGSTQLPQQVTNTLTSIDTVPTRQQLDSAFDNSPAMALENLASLATDPDPSADVGIRLRAIHALAKYCSSTPCADTDVAHQSLTSVIQANTTESSGSPLLVLRAAIETLGTMRISSDVSLLLPLLDHPSRDIRASTAHALLDLCNTQAIAPLSVRLSQEPTLQVKLAISEALRILGQCSANP